MISAPSSFKMGIGVRDQKVKKPHGLSTTQIHIFLTCFHVALTFDAWYLFFFTTNSFYL
jgi:hypothetical protein